MKQNSYSKYATSGLLLLALMFSGCSSSNDSNDRKVATLPVSVAGELDDDVKGLMEKAGLINPGNEQGDFANLSFQNSDILVFAQKAITKVPVSGSSSDTITKTLFENANGKNKAIVIVKPTQADVEHLSNLHDNSTNGFDLILPQNGTMNAEVPSERLPLIYAQKVDADGNISVFAHYDDYKFSDGAITIPERGQADGFFELKKWLDMKNNDLVSQNNTSDAGAEKDILKYAKSYAATLSSNYWGKSFVINQYIIPVHDFKDESDPKGGSDWYFMQQNGILNGGCGYTKETECCWWYSRIKNYDTWVGRGHVIDNYMYRYRIENRLQVNRLTGDELIHPPVPAAINNETNTTTSTGVSVGAEEGGGVNVSAAGPTAEANAKLTYGYNSTKTESFSTRDVNTSLDTNHIEGKVAWEHRFTEPKQDKEIGRWMWLIDGAELARSTYTPIHMWMWRLTNEQRDKPKVEISLRPVRGGMYSRNSGSLEPVKVTGDEPNISKTISLPQPPILAIEEHNISFDKKPATTTIRVGSQGAWTASKGNSTDTWYNFSQQANNLHITVNENTTGANRSADIIIRRNGGPVDEKQKLNIIQFITNK